MIKLFKQLFIVFALMFFFGANLYAQSRCGNILYEKGKSTQIGKPYFRACDGCQLVFSQRVTFEDGSHFTMYIGQSAFSGEKYYNSDPSGTGKWLESECEVVKSVFGAGKIADKNIGGNSEHRFKILNKTDRQMSYYVSYDEGVNWQKYTINDGLATTHIHTEQSIRWKLTTEGHDPIIYKITSDKQYKIEWNKNKGVWDLFYY